MPDLHSVQFDVDTLTLAQEDGSTRVWQSAVGDMVSLHYFAVPPDIGAPLNNLSAIRDSYRRMIVQAGGALVEVDAGELDGLPALVTIFKFPQQPTGMAYLGSWTLPRRDFSFVIKIGSPELGVTGMRDTAVYLKWSAERPGLNDSGDPMAGWLADPYDPTFQATVLRNPSDDRQWDQPFPDHPLSRVRATLERVKRTIKFDASILGSTPFGA